MECIACKATKFVKKQTNYIYSDTDFKKIFPNIECVKCMNCKLVQVEMHESKKIFDEKLTEYYKRDYRSDGKNSLSKKSEEWYRKRGKAITEVGKEYFSENDEINIFEFGAGYGINLDELHKAFPLAKLYTNEINEKCFENLDNLKINHKEIADFKKEIDYAILSHVIEHLVYPEEVILDIARKMRKNGIMYIEVPNNTRGNMVFIEPHISFFGKESLYKFYINQLSDEFELVSLYETGAALKHTWLNSKAMIWGKKYLGATGIYNDIFEKTLEKAKTIEPTRKRDFSKENKNGLFLKMILRKK